MNMTFEEEYADLLKLIKFKDHRRYGTDLYAKYCFDGGYEWKHEYNICELVWGFCKNPCFAKELVVELDNNVIDMNVFMKTLAKGNKKIKSNKLCCDWDSAIAQLDTNDSNAPFIVYSTENSHLWSDKKIFCDDIDGELWHGILMTPDVLYGLDHITLELSGKNSDGVEWLKEIRWAVEDIIVNSRAFDEELNLFTPFKHPLILTNSGISLNVYFNFIDGKLFAENQIKMVYGICSSSLKKWIEDPTSPFTTELAFGDKIIIDTSNSIVNYVCGSQ